MKGDEFFARFMTRIEAIRNLERGADKELKHLLPTGTRVLFQFGRMVAPAPADVLGARISMGYPEVLLRNTITDKERRVPLHAITWVSDPNLEIPREVLRR